MNIRVNERESRDLSTRPLRGRAELSLARVLVIFLAGVLAGVQIALFLFDLYDDGTAELRSGLIGLIFLLLGLAFAIWSFRKRKL
jgi:hypothetical protein